MQTEKRADRASLEWAWGEVDGLASRGLRSKFDHLVDALSALGAVPADAIAHVADRIDDLKHEGLAGDDLIRTVALEALSTGLALRTSEPLPEGFDILEAAEDLEGGASTSPADEG